MAERKKPQTSPQLDASARAVPEDRAAAGKKTDPKHAKKMQEKIDRATSKIQADNEFESSTGVRVNVAALKGLCLRGPNNRREELLARIDETLVRVGTRKTGGQPFGRGKGSDNYPNIHDLLRWLGAIEKDSKADLDLLRRCRATLTR